MADLKTNYVDDVLDTTKNQLRKYQQIKNDDGTVSFVDVTEYTQVGTSFGAKDINDTNAAINDVNGKLGDKTLGVITDISSFIGSNYIIPSDGYIRLIPTSTSSPIGLTDIRNNTTLIEAHYITSIFVRKGITLKIDGSGRIGFIPLINK